MELPFILKKALEAARDGWAKERERDVYDEDQRKAFTFAITQVNTVLNAERNAESDAEFAEMYPEHAKFDKVRDKAQAIGEFIEHGGWLLCKWPEGESHPKPTNFTINQVLGDYFEIDTKVLENEKRAMLERLANPNAAKIG